MLDSALGNAPVLHVEATGPSERPPWDATVPLVLLHGWAMNLRVFDSLVEAMSRERCVYTVDLPGHGRSPLPKPASLQCAGAATAPGAPASAVLDVWLEAILRPLPPVFDLCGWSLGGQLAMAIAARAPQRLRRLVLLATTPRFCATEGWSHGAQAGVWQRMLLQLSADYRGTVSGLLELQVRGSQEASAVLQILRGALFEHGEAGAEALRVGLSLLAELDLRGSLSSICAPTLVLAGQHDRVTPASAGRWIAAQLVDARYEEFARAGHAPFLSHAAACHALIGEFLGTGR